MRKRRIKNVKLDTQSKVESARKKVNEALIMFSQADDALSEANQELLNTIEDSNRELNSLNAKIKTEEQERQKALDELEANQKLKEQLKPFLL
jgi:vacuolar-type H+-ATPase subunit I/STV1